MNYIGSKYSLLDFIEKSIQKVTGYRDGNGKIFGDLFAGTGAIGKLFKSKGYKVIANDIQYYSYVLNKHFIENSNKLDYSIAEKLNSLPLVKGFIYKNYCKGSGSRRNYFTDENGMKCDAIRLEIERLYNECEIDENTYFYYLASLVNSIDKYANTASVYGAFLKHTKKTAQKKFRMELLEIVPGKIGKVYNKDINELIKKISGDILYLDPPYNQRQYSSNYHVLETIARYDYPELKGVTGLRNSNEQKSKFCSKIYVEEEFEKLIKSSNFKYIFLSYNNEGLMPLDTIKEIMSRYGKYDFFTKEYRRFKADNNRKVKCDSTVEYLHFLIKKGPIIIL